jgi:hypothetical protein
VLRVLRRRPGGGVDPKDGVPVGVQEELVRVGVAVDDLRLRDVVVVVRGVAGALPDADVGVVLAAGRPDPQGFARVRGKQFATVRPP